MKNFNKKKSLVIIFAILLIIIFFFYLYFLKKQHTINNKIFLYIENNCEDIDTCQVKLSDFTNFEWDTVCLPNSGSTLDFAPEQIPAYLPKKYKLQNPKLIFISHNEIVWFEEIPINIENIVGRTIYFSVSNVCITDKNKAIFQVKKRHEQERPFINIKNLVYYELFLLKDN